MAEIVLHPCHTDYCNECVYHGSEFGNCLNENYNKNSYKVNCVWHFCPYKRKKGEMHSGDNSDIFEKR